MPARPRTPAANRTPAGTANATRPVTRPVTRPDVNKFSAMRPAVIRPSANAARASATSPETTRARTVLTVLIVLIVLIARTSPAGEAMPRADRAIESRKGVKKPAMPLLRNCLFAGAALLCIAAQAQVLRCTDARTGQVTYTDGACAGAATVREVEPRKTAQAIQQEREQAAQALAHKQQQQQAEAAARQIEADHDARRERELAERAARRSARPQDHARSAECARSRRNLDIAVSSASGTYDQNLRVETAQRQMDLDCLGPEAYAELEKARAARPETAPSVVLVPPRQRVYTRPASPPPPRQITQCNVFRCYDSQGNSYPR